VPELEAVAAAGQLAERLCEPVVIALERRRQLPDDRAELGRPRQRLDALVVAGDPLVEVAELLDVRQEAAGLEGEDEVLRGLFDPALDGLE
jgi:hypothetical protein